MAIDAHNMGVQPANVGPAAVASAAAALSSGTVRMGEQLANVGPAGVELVLGAAALELLSPVRPSGRVDRSNLGFCANPPALALAPSPCGFPGAW